MTLFKKLRKLELKYKKHIENAYSFKFSDPSLSDYFEFKAYTVLAKLDYVKRIGA